MIPKSTPKRISTGIFLKIAHSLIFTVMSMLLMKYSKSLPILQVLFCRVVAGSFIAFAILKLIKQPIPLKMSKQSVIFYGARAFISFIAMSGWVITLKNIGVNEAVALGYVMPIWLIISAVLFFKEKLTIQHVVIVSLNMLGVILILQPKFDTIDTMSLIAALTSGLLWTIYNSICKKQTETEHYMLQCFYTFVFSAVITLPLAIYLWEPIVTEQFFGLTLLGFVGVMNVSVLFLAYAYTPLIILVPFDYLRLLISMVLSYLLLSTPLTPGFLTGAAVIVSADLYFYITQRAKKIRLNN